MKKLTSLLLALVLVVGLVTTSGMETKAAETKTESPQVRLWAESISPLRANATGMAFAGILVENNGTEDLDLSQYVFTGSVGGHKAILRTWVGSEEVEAEELVVNNVVKAGESQYLMMRTELDVEDVVLVQGRVTMKTKNDSVMVEEGIYEFPVYDVDVETGILSFRLGDDAELSDHYRLRWDIGEHCVYGGLVYGGPGSAIEIEEMDGDFYIPFLGSEPASSVVLHAEEGYVLESVELVPRDAGTVKKVDGTDGTIFEISLNKPATLKARATTKEDLASTGDILFETTENTKVPEDARLVVNETECAAEKNFLIKELGTVAEQMAAYDLSLVDALGKDVTFEGKVKVSLPIPEGWTTSQLAVYYVNAETGEKEDMHAVVDADGKHITFETSHFSTFILVNMNKEDANSDNPENITDKQSDVPKTGDVQNVSLWISLVLISCISVMNKKRKSVR